MNYLAYMLETVFEFVSELEGPGLLILFLVLVACGLGLPLPEDITLAAAGMMVSGGMVKFGPATAVCLLGILVGDSCVYWLGRSWSKHLFKTRLLRRIFNDRFVATGEKAFARFGNKIIFLARFLPGLRAPIYFFAGGARISFFFFVLVDAVAACISVPVWIYVGKLFTDNLPALEKAIQRMQIGSVLLAGFFVALLIGANYIKKWMRRKIGP